MHSAGYYLSRVWLGTTIHTALLPRLPKPYFANLKLTENCQAQCTACDYWKSRWRDAIDTGHAIDLVNQMSDLGITSLRFTGGEPLLRTDLFEILENANTDRFRNIIIQTNGLLLKKLHQEINASPIGDVCVSLDGLRDTNDAMRGVRGYFDLAMEGIGLLRAKKVTISVTLNRFSAKELEGLARAARAVGAGVHYNLLDHNPYFFRNGKIEPLWPGRDEVREIAAFVRDVLKRPHYEVDYIARYYNRELDQEPPCVLGFLEVFVVSNGDVMTGCYVLEPVGNILRERLDTILASEAWYRQALAMLRRQCPGCTCGIETSLAMKHAATSGLFELRALLASRTARVQPGAPEEVA